MYLKCGKDTTCCGLLFQSRREEAATQVIEVGKLSLTKHDAATDHPHHLQAKAVVITLAAAMIAIAAAITAIDGQGASLHTLSDLDMPLVPDVIKLSTKSSFIS